MRCFLPFLLFSFREQDIVTNADMIFWVVIWDPGSTINISLADVLWKNIRRITPSKWAPWIICERSFCGNKRERRADGNPLLPECCGSQSVALGKDSLHWGLRRELCTRVYTVNSCSSCDHRMMVSDNRSWLWFKVKNNSLLAFFPSGSVEQKVWDVIWDSGQSIVGTGGVRWAQWPTGSQPSLWLSHFLRSQRTSRQKHHYCSWALSWWTLGSETARNKLDRERASIESFPVIQTPSGKCYTTMFPIAVFVSLISHDELVAAFPGSLRLKQMVPQRTRALFLKVSDLILWFYWISLQVKGRGCECKRCTDACQHVNRSVGRRPRQREEQDSDSIVLHKTGSSHTIEHVFLS